MTEDFEHPVEHNSGRLQVRGQFRFQRHLVNATSPPDGTPFSLTIHPPGANEGADVVITVQNPIFQGRYNFSAQRGQRQYMNLACFCRMKSDGTQPILIEAA